jgi:hypothetical protein
MSDMRTIDHRHFGPRPPTLRAGHALVAIDGALYLRPQP